MINNAYPTISNYFLTGSELILLEPPQFKRICAQGVHDTKRQKPVREVSRAVISCLHLDVYGQVGSSF